MNPTLDKSLARQSCSEEFASTSEASEISVVRSWPPKTWTIANPYHRFEQIGLDIRDC